MSNLFKKAIFLFVVILGLFFIGAGLYVHASQSITMTDGAQIRTTGDRQGLRFTATATEAFAEGSEHGYYVALGEHALLTMTTAIQANETMVGSNKLVKIVIPEPDLTFSLVIYNIPERAYKQDITAIPYIYHNGTYTFPSLLVTRNIAEIAVAAYPSYGGEVPPIVASAATQQVSYTMNGGAFTEEKAFTITKYNIDDSGKYLKISDATAGQLNKWWCVLYLQATTNPNVFEIIKYTDSGTELYTGAYDKIIGVHDTCLDQVGYNTIKALMAQSSIGKYIRLSSVPTVAGTVSIEAKVYPSTDFEYACASTSQNYTNAVTLRTAKKPYYDFKGWYANAEHTGEAVTTIAAGNSGAVINLYAKFTPTVYTLSFNLQSGSCSQSTENVNFTVESAQILLPAAGTMSRANYEFVEWNTKADGTGETKTSIPTGSHGDVTVYAIWASITPTVVQLSEQDTAIITATNPTKFVKADFTAGWFTINSTTYKVGEGELFANISLALSAASANDVIYVFAGTYSNPLTISTSNITLVGAGANKTLVHTDTYAVDTTKEALITKELIIASGVSNTTIKGFSMTAQVTLSGNATVNISNIIFGNMTGYDTGLDGSIRIRGASSNVTIDKMYLTSYCANRGIHINALTTNFTLTNSVVLGSVTNLVDFCRFGQTNVTCAAGNIYIADNYIQKCSQTGFMDRLPKNASYRVIHNTFDSATAAIYMRPNDSIGTASYEIKYNTFNKCGSTSLNWDDIGIGTGANTTLYLNYNIITNSYDRDTNTYNIYISSASGTIDCANNYVDEASKPNDNKNATGFTLLTSADEVETAYQAYLNP